MVEVTDIDDKIVLFGQSCSGKTTFAQSLKSHYYYCFDALFQWHLVETLGLSIAANLEHVRDSCDAVKYVLDGWHLSDKEGVIIPQGASVYVIWAPYERIISQYRVPVSHHEEHRQMYRRWYCDIDYDSLPGVRYFHNEHRFKEITRDQFICLRAQNQ